MTRNEILTRWPRASESFIRSNLGTPSPFPVNAPWSESEVEKLKSYYADTPAEEFSIQKFADSIGRTFAAVALKASKLEISGKRTDPATFSNDHVANISKAQKNRVERDGPEILTRGLRKYMQGGKNGFTGHHHTEENKNETSLRFKAWHGSNPHPRGMRGKKHSKEFCEKMSLLHSGKKVPREQVMKMLKTKAANGTLVNPRPEASWKCGWEEVGGKRFYARSRWEANYGRYLEWQKLQGLIVDWDHEPKTFWFEGIKRGVMSYLPDFWVKTKTGEEYHEVKGWMDARSVTKIKRMAKYHPTIKLQVIDSVRYRTLAKQLKQIVPGWAP